MIRRLPCPGPRALARGAAAAMLLGLAACVFVPRTVSVYDPRCGAHAEQMVLEVEQVAAFAACSNDGCIALLAAAGAVSAISAVVSGSIVVAGNIVYWLERRGDCPPPR